MKYDPDQPFTEYELERMSLDASEPEDDDRRTCGLCGCLYLPWPGHEKCPGCGQEPKTVAA